MNRDGLVTAGGNLRLRSGRNHKVEVHHRQPAEALSDELLLEGFAAGDEMLAVAFVRRFQAAVFGVALAVIGDGRAAEDVAQWCFERAWRHAAGYDARRGGVRTWLVAIAHNLAVDTARAHRSTPVDPADLVALLEPDRETAEKHVLRGETVAQLRAALAVLPEEQSRAVVLAAVHGMTAREIAVQEGIPLGTAKTRIRAAVSKLHTALVASRSRHD
jgi:RNA polymerase sigma-70 factor (ECF subfamily)